MENWGLITYRETDLLYNPTRDQISNKRRVSLVISHELAHQWVYLLKIYMKSALRPDLNFLLFII